MRIADSMPPEDFLKYAASVIASEYGSQKEFAKKSQMTCSYVSDIMRGNRAPSEKFLSAIGAERVVLYRLVPVAK